jgi:hypothetical protein
MRNLHHLAAMDVETLASSATMLATPNARQCSYEQTDSSFAA